VDQTVGATGSFDRWYRVELPRVLGLLTVVAGDADVAREATAEAFTRALERWDRVGAMEAPAAWTYRVGVNLLRRRMRRVAFERGLLPDPPTPPAPPAIDSALWAAVRALPPRQRTAIGLRYVCDLPVDEVAAVMGVATGTVSATLTAARRRLAVDLARPEPAEVRRD
jgi:DNA-directed RNA polymerase specialized sigma24 family protein